MKTKHYHGHRKVLNCIAVINWLMLVAACFIAPLVLQAVERNHLPVTTKGIGWDVMPVAHLNDFPEERLYVRKGHTGSGASWDDALGELSDAIEQCLQLNTTTNPVIREIWVASGIYKPTGLPSGYTTSSPNVTARDRTFELPRGVMIYGGFAGNEVTLAARDLTVGTNASVLSGDLDNNNMLSAGDAHHVVTSRLGNAETGLDGFLIMGGNADVNSFFAYTRRTKGAGIYLYSSSAVLRNLHIELNRAWEGAGIYMEGQPVAGNPNPVFENLSIRNNSGLQGVGMFIDGCHPEITGGAISDNTMDGVDNPASLRQEGGGVRISNAAAPRFDDVSIHNNKSVWGGGVFLEGSFPMMTNSSIRGNQAAAGGGIHERGVSKGIYTNLLIAGNFADGGTGGSGISGFGGGVFSHRSESVYTNVTIAGNRATGNVLDANGKGGIHSLSDVDDTGDAKAPTLRNSIIWGNSSGINYELPAGKRIIMHHRSFVQEMLPAFAYSNSSETDPQFVAPVDFTDAPTVAGNYRLQSSSLGLDHGIGTYYGATQTPDLSAIVTDLDGHPRFYNAGFVDLGAYEFQGEPNAPQTRLYVMQGGTGTGSNWDDALGELAEALQLIHSGTLTAIEEIWVAKGVYRPAYRAGNGVVDRDKAFVLPPDVQLYGGFAGNEQQLAQRVLGTLNTSVLSGDLDNNGQHSDGDAYHVVIAAGDVGEAVLDGFTITGGTSEIGDSGGGLVLNGSTVGRQHGSGIHIINGSPVLRNLIIRDNGAHTRGGGIHISGSGHPQLTGIQLIDNHALDGGGMAVFGGTATLERVTFSENTADNSGGGLYVNSSSTVTMRNSLIHHNSTSNSYGGGIYNSASVLALTNVTVAANESLNNTGDGIMNTSSGQLSLINSIVYGNAGGAADYDLVNQNTVNSPTINYSIVGTYQGGVSRADADPRFTDPEQGDFSLAFSSVAINSGDPETNTEGYPVQAGDWDVTGAARLYDGRIDMGALEYSGTVYRPFVTAWKTDNGGTSNDDQLTIPITGTGYDMAIDWGDGAITTWKDGDDVASLTHTYLAAGTYNVRISGDFPRIYFNNAGDRQKILDVVQWGDITWHSMEAAFAGAANMAMSATDAPDLSNVTSTKQMLMGAGAFDSPIGHWDVSTIEDMSQMFQQTVSFNQSLAAWDVTHVETMALMFNGSGLSTANYDAILMAWAEQDVQDDVPFGADQLTYCAGKAARQSLIDDRRWVFSGDNKAADCVTDGPVLVAPANGAYNVERPVTLQWEAVDGASGYHVRLIEAGGDFDSPFFSANSPTTSREVTSLQGNYTLYAWRVQAIVDGELTAWSDVWGFTTGAGDVPGIAFTDSEVMYDGTPKTISLMGTLPDGVTVTYTNNGQTDAGVYEVTAHIDGGGIYSDAEMTATLTITRAPSVITASAVQTHTYNGGYKLVAATLNHDEAELQYDPADRFTDVGEHEVTVSVAQSGNYEAASVTVQVVIEPGQQGALGMASRVITYDGEVHSLFVTGAAPDATIVYDGNDHVGAGTYAVTATVTRPNYEPAVLTGTLTITPRNVAITIGGDHQKVYGDADPEAYTYTVTNGSLVDGDGPTGAFEREPGENVQVYPVRKGTFTFGDNYNLIVNQGYLRIIRAPSVITADAVQTYTYTGELHQIVATLNHAQAPLIYNPVDRGYTDVGEYEITVRVNQSLNYEAADLVVTQIIEPAEQTNELSLPSRTVTYNGGAHNLAVENLPANATVTYVGNGQTNVGTYTVTATVTQPGVSPVELTATLAINRATAVITANAVQTYPYTGSEIGVAATLNHEETGLTYSPVTGYVDPGSYQIIVAAPQTPNYTAASRTITLRIVPAETVHLPSATVVYTGEPQYLAIANLPAGATVSYTHNGPVNVGVYTITATVSLPGEPDAVFEATLTIERATPVITAEVLQTHTYDGNVKDVVASLDHDEVELDYLPARGYTLPGTYDITVRAMQSTNYTAAFSNVRLVVHPRDAQGDYVLPSRTVTYNGQSHGLAVENLPGDATVAYDVDGVVDVGVYTITATVTRPGYTTEMVTGTLTIERAAAVITAAAVQQHAYDGTPKSAMATLNHDEVELTYSPAQSFIEAGTYAVTVNVAQSANYTAASATMTLVINGGPAPVEGPVLANRTVTYDGSEHRLVVSNIPDDATVVYTHNGHTDAGSYTVKALVTLNDGSEHALSAVLVIEKALIAGVTLSDGTFTYDGTAKTLAVSGTLPAGTTLSYTNNSRTAVGSQAVMATISGENYEPLELMATLAVTPAGITGVTLADGSFAYDGTAKSLAVSGALPAGTTVSYTNNSRTAVGSQAVMATISGDNYESLELTATLTVTPVVRSIQFPSIPAKTFGDDDFPAGAVANTGETIVYASSNEQVAVVQNGIVQIVGIGTATITATVAPNANYSNTPVVTQQVTVAKGQQTISLRDIGEVSREVGSIDLGASSSSGLPVTLTLDDEQVASLDGTSLRILRLGTVRITATQAGSANYDAAIPVTITVRVVDPAAKFPVRIHQAVSPNGDGINEFLMIEGIRDYPENRVTIFNKNGTIVYEVNGYDNGTRSFTGKGSGSTNLPAGTYFYIVEIKEGVNWTYHKGYFVLRY